MARKVYPGDEGGEDEVRGVRRVRMEERGGGLGEMMSRFNSDLWFSFAYGSWTSFSCPLFSLMREGEGESDFVDIEDQKKEKKLKRMK